MPRRNNENDSLEVLLQRIRERLQQATYPNEAAVREAIVIPILKALSWPVQEPLVVYREYTIGGQRVDYALCDPQTRSPLVFLEVKSIGYDLTGESQLFEYAFHQGIKIAVLTDGARWLVYLPLESGDYTQRRVTLLDLRERDIRDCIYYLERYLDYESVLSGAAYRKARRDLRQSAQRRVQEERIQEALPRAWQELIDPPDEQLIKLLVDRVESLCGYRPEASTIVNFLRTQPHPSFLSPPQGTVYRDADCAGRYGFEFRGEWHPVHGRTACAVLIAVFEHLMRTCPNFAQRFSQQIHGRLKRYLSPDPQEVHPDNPSLMKQLSNGWWLDANLSRDGIERRVRQACEIAGIQYGSELKVCLG